MDIKMMHEMKEKLAECAKHELDKGIESIDTKEFGEVIDMIKDLAEAEYYATITVEMKKEENEYGEDYDFMGPYEERRYYRGQRRDSRGRFMSNRGRGGRRGYEEMMYYTEPPYMHMMEEYPMTLDDFRNRSMEELRDMDRTSRGRMYYTDNGMGNRSGSYSGNSGMGGNSGGSRNYGGDTGNNRSGYGNSGNQGESRSERARRNYTETKEMHKDNSAESKQKKMKDLEEYMKELSMDVTEMISDASPEEKQLLKQKMSMLVTKLN